jgi:hypothetical protein
MAASRLLPLVLTVLIPNNNLITASFLTPGREDIKTQAAGGAPVVREQTPTPDGTIGVPPSGVIERTAASKSGPVAA